MASIPQETLTKYGISPEGDLLSNLITMNVLKEFSSNQPIEDSILFDGEYDDVSTQIIMCFKKFKRLTNYRMNKCIEKAIIDYMTNYSKIDLESEMIIDPSDPVGVAMGLPTYPPVDIGKPLSDGSGNENTSIPHVGFLEHNSIHKHMFTLFSTGRLFGLYSDDGNTENQADMIKNNSTVVVEQFFDDIVSWLSIGTIGESAIITNPWYVNTSGMSGSFAIKGNGSISFTASEDQLNGIISKVKRDLSKLNAQNYVYYLEKSVPTKYYQELVWGIICTGLVSILNINMVVTEDKGLIFYSDDPSDAVAPTPATMASNSYPYNGASIGVCEFGTTYQLRMKVTLFEVLGFEVGLFVRKSLNKISRFISNIIFTSIELYEKVMSFLQDLIEEIRIGVFTIVDDVKTFFNNLSKKIETVYRDILKFFQRIGAVFTEISDKLRDIYGHILNIFEEVVDVVNDAIEFVVDKVRTFIASYIVRPLRQLQWNIFKSAIPNPIVVKAIDTYLFVVDNYNRIMSTVTRALKAIIFYDKLIVALNTIINLIAKIELKLRSISLQLKKIPCIPLSIPVISMIKIPDIPEMVNLDVSETPSIPDEVDDDGEKVKMPDISVVGKTPSDKIEYDDQGNIINENILVQESTYYVIDAFIPTPKLLDVNDFNIPEPPAYGDIRNEIESKPRGERISNKVKDGYVRYYNDVKTYRTSVAMQEHIKRYEMGYSGKLKPQHLKAFQDPNKITALIGYGHNIGDWNRPSSWEYKGSITQELAEELFQKDLLYAESVVKRNVTMFCTQGQFDAWVDLVYTRGTLGYRPTKNDDRCVWDSKSGRCDWVTYNTIKKFNMGDIYNSGDFYKITAVSGGTAGKLSGLSVRRDNAYRKFFINNWGI